MQRRLSLRAGSSFLSALCGFPLQTKLSLILAEKLKKKKKKVALKSVIAMVNLKDTASSLGLNETVMIGLNSLSPLSVSISID